MTQAIPGAIPRTRLGSGDRGWRSGLTGGGEGAARRDPGRSQHPLHAWQDRGVPPPHAPVLPEKAFAESFRKQMVIDGR